MNCAPQHRIIGGFVRFWFSIFHLMVRSNIDNFSDIRCQRYQMFRTKAPFMKIV